MGAILNNYFFLTNKYRSLNPSKEIEEVTRNGFNRHSMAHDVSKC